MAWFEMTEACRCHVEHQPQKLRALSGRAPPGTGMLAPALQLCSSTSSRMMQRFCTAVQHSQAASASCSLPTLSGTAVMAAFVMCCDSCTCVTYCLRTMLLVDFLLTTAAHRCSCPASKLRSTLCGLEERQYTSCCIVCLHYACFHLVPSLAGAAVPLKWFPCTCCCILCSLCSCL
jgi:hypothetical protein